MDTLKYIVKRLLLSIVILLGVSIIIYAIARMMPVDFVDGQFASQIAQGTMQQEDLDRIKELYGLNMPDAYLDARIGGEAEFANTRLRRNTKVSTYEEVQNGISLYETWYAGQYDGGDYRLVLAAPTLTDGEWEQAPLKYSVYKVTVLDGFETTGDEDGSGDEDNSGGIKLKEELVLLEEGTYLRGEDGTLTLTSNTGVTSVLTMSYRAANFWDKAGAIFGGYFTWLFNILQGDFGISFKYKQPVGDVIVQNMGISFAIAFISTILQFAIAIPLGIKAATNQYGVIDYTVTVLVMIGISLPTFFLGAIVIRLFSVQLGWFPVSGLTSSLSFGGAWYMVLADVLWHMVLPMFVLVVLSVGSLMRYTRTNTLEVLNADYIRTARAKGLSERSVIYKHAFRNTMIPLITMMAGILPSLFGGAMITETVFAIPGIGKMAYDALIVADVPFIMGYNMFLAIMTVIGTLLSDLMYAVVDPRVKLTK